MAPSKTITKKTTKKASRSSSSKKKTSSSSSSRPNTSSSLAAPARSRGRPRGPVPPARLAILKAAREAHKTLANKKGIDRIVADPDIPYQLRPGAVGVRRIITRAVTAKFKWGQERLEVLTRAEEPDDPSLANFPWKEKFADGSEGPIYYGNGVWRSNRWMID